MMTIRKTVAGVLAFVCILTIAQATYAYAQKPEDTVLRPADLELLLPKSVFFRGQSAPVQLRNAGGIRYADGMYFFAALVDTSGYSTGVRAKYQAYMVTEVSILIGSEHLSPGAYGVGFTADHKFLVMDVGAHDLFTVADDRDDTLRRPTPLQIIQGSNNGEYRLYDGREFVTVKRESR